MNLLHAFLLPRIVMGSEGQVEAASEVLAR